MRRRKTKRSISMFMALILVLGMIVTTLPAGLFSTTLEAAVSYNPDIAGVCLMPANAYTNQQFMRMYVFGSSNYNLNKNFKADSWSGNITPGLSKGAALDRTKRTKKNHDSLWYANWRYYPNKVMKSLMSKGQIQIGYRTNLYNDKHSNKRHWSKEWGKAMVELKGSSQGSLLYSETENKNDEQPQQFEKICKVGSNNYFNYWAGNNRCVCNGSCVGENNIYAVDTVMPQVTSCYISKSMTGSALNNGGFKAKETGYLILECSESIRFGNAESSALKLNLKTYHKKNGQEAGTISAQLVKLEGNKMVFSFTVPEKIANQATDVVVRTVEMPGGSDTWASARGNYSAKLLDENGKAKTYFGFGLTAISKITDLAGNGLNWSAGTKTVSNQVFLDNVKVGVQKVSLDVTKAQRADIPVDESEGDATLSDVFTAVGDKLSFTVTFDDKIDYPSDSAKKQSFLDNISATLNVKDANGFVKLKAKSVNSLSAAEADGVDSALGSKTQITFEILNITADMYQEGGEPVKITSLNGMSNVKDICGNVTTGMDNVTIAPERQQFIDRLAPKTTLNLDVTDGVYTPVSSENGKVLTFPVNVDDVKESKDADGVYSSGVTGIIAGFKWICGTGSDTYAYDYYWSTTSKVSDNAVWKRLYTTVDENDDRSNVNGKIIQFEKENGTLYLHIRLVDGIDYGAATEEKAGNITGNLVFSTMDYAGNKGKDSFALSYFADNKAPSLEQKKSSIDGNAQRTSAEITTTLNVSDEYGVQSVTYQWSGQSAQQCDITSYTDRRNIEIPVKGSYDDTDVDSDKKKTVSLKVTVTDFAGHTTEETYEYTLFFGKVENRYSINVGTADKPLARPELIMKQPDALVNTDGSLATLLSFTEVQFSDNERYIYICNSTTEKDIFTQNDWYYVESKYTDDGSPGAPQLTYNYSSTNGGKSAYESLINKLATCYGTGEVSITVRTVDNFNNASGTLKVYYDSLDAIAINEHSDIYLANAGDYSATVKNVIDSNSQDIKGMLSYDAQTSTSTAYSIDGVSFIYTLAGKKEGNFNYNLADIDASASYVRLRKTSDGSKHTIESADTVDNSDTICEKYDFTATREQGITVSTGVSEDNGSGWYYLEFVVTTTDGDCHVTYYNDIYIDRYVYTDLWSGYYNKTYSRVIEYKSEQKEAVYKLSDNIDLSFASEYGYVVGMGIAAPPEGYTVTQQVSFEGKLPETESGIERNLKFRVYNQADSANAKNAQWRDLTESEGVYSYIYNVSEAAVDDSGKYVFDEASYCKDGQYYIPVTEGRNVICYEVLNTNGQIDKKTLFINATKQTVPKDYIREESKIEHKLQLSENVFAECPEAVMKLHEFYTEDVRDSYNSISCYEPGSWEFVMYNASYNTDVYNLENYNDNLVADTFTAEDVDGIEPDTVVEYQQDGMNFCFKINVSDNNELDMNDLLKIRYDGYYGYKIKKANGTLNGSDKEGEPAQTDEPLVTAAPSITDEPLITDNPQVTGDPYEEAEYTVNFGQSTETSGAACWEDYSSVNYGIYKTQYIPNDSENNTGGCIYVWGTFMYQNDVPEGEMCYGGIQLSVNDANGNESYNEQPFSYENKKPELKVNGSAEQRNEYPLYGNMYSYDDTTNFDSNGNLFVESESPLSRIYNYGAGTNVAAVAKQEVIVNPGEELTAYSDYKYHFLSPLTMLHSAGQYELEYTDLFGNTYNQELDTTGAFEEGSDRIRINYSETKQTNQNVTVMANLEAVSGEAMAPDAKILTITAVSVDENGNRITDKNGEIDQIDSTAARIVMEDNGEVYVEGIYDGQIVSKNVKVSNIDKKIEDVTPVFLYDNGSTEPYFMDGSSDTVDGPVKVILQCDEDLYGLNGDTKYIFPVGSKKGDKYTFEYRDEAGNTGSLTVNLPYNIDKTVLPEPDTTAPEFQGIVSGLRRGYTALDGVFDVDENGNLSETSRVNDSMAQYVARGYKMAFQITDESKVKLIAKKAGAAAPVSYSDSGDSIDGLKIAGYTVEITKPAQFDLYFVDEAGNVKALKGFSVDSFDNEAADVKVEYKVLRDDNDIAFVRAYLVADVSEDVIATNLDATTFMNEETVTENGVETTKLVKHYYHDFFDNETYEFTYTDVYGNSGNTTAQVQGFDYGAPSSLSVQWFGTRRMTGTESGSYVMNESPDTEGLSLVNNDVTANISYNKPVSDVKLYAYDETKENGVGEELTSEAAVSAEYFGKNVTVTYADNYAGQIVVSAQAKNNGKRDYTTLPSVQCIDKKAPVITVSQGILSQNKQSMTYTITTDEETFFNKGTKKATEHTYTVNKNGESIINVMDMAGNSSTVTINVTEIDDNVMELLFGLQSDGSDMTTDIDKLDIKAGDTLYVKSSKDAQIICNGRSFALKADETGSLIVSTNAGMHMLRAVDTSTGKEQSYKVLMTLKDNSAPLISFDSAILSFSMGTDGAVIEDALKSGITIEDNKDGIIDSSKAVISGIPKQWNKGIHIINYEVSDAEGNTAHATRSVYVYEEGTPNIKINGTDAVPYGTTVVNSSTIKVSTTGTDKGAVLMKIRPGVKTAAQMKYGTMGTMLKGAAKNEWHTFVLPNKSGFYTLYIRTQERKEQIVYVYVDLSE